MPGRVKFCGNCSHENHFRRNACVECGVGLRQGRPDDTTQEAGYDVGKRGGRPHSTTQEAGYDVGQGGGRPHGTTREAGYDVGRSRGRPCDRSRTINFSDSIELPTEWDHSDELVNIDDKLLGLFSRRIT